MFKMSKDKFIELRKKVLEKEFSKMNDMQREAVFHVDGPLLILAGAGSGKTTVVVNRIASLIRYGKAYESTYVQSEVSDEDIAEMEGFLQGQQLSEDVKKRISVSTCAPWRIMAITFTNKAAGELKERLMQMLGQEGKDIWASTFHSTCGKILRRDGTRLGYTNHFTIYDSDDSKKLMRECLKLLEIPEKNMPAKAVLSEISRAKDRLITPQEFEEEAGSDYRLKIIAKAYKLYQGRLISADAMDFDDLIVNTVRLLKGFPEVLEYYGERFKYLMVDEYQDTNQAQYQLVKLLASRHQNLCVVGDDDQSIYKFRGATIENIMSFERTFENAKVIRLEQNYRSTQHILDAANNVIENNTERKGKNLWTDNGDGELIGIHTAENEQDEADKIAAEILRLVAEGRKYSDFAVLYRMNSQSLSLERMFAKQGVPHRILGGTRFYDRAEIKDMLSYLCVVNNPNDEIRLKRIINQPKRGIGDRTVDMAADIAHQLGISLFEVISNSEEYGAIARATGKLKEFIAMINGFVDCLNDETKSINDLYLKIIEDTGFISYLKTSDPDKAEDRTENIKELSSNIMRYEQDGRENEIETSLSAFLEDIALITDIDNYDQAADTVVLMTVHSAKGLEFPVVFLPGWEENVFPGTSSVYEPAQVEEERRLAYVAITRAKERLYIYNAEQRMIFGSTTRNKLSRFAEEIPTELTDRSRSSRFGRAFGAAPSTQAFGGGGGVFAPKSASFANSTVADAGGFKSPEKSGSNSFSSGDTVSHKTFGKGVILSTKPMGNDTLLEIAFDAGTKLLGANFAKLNKM